VFNANFINSLLSKCTVSKYPFLHTYQTDFLSGIDFDLIKKNFVSDKMLFKHDSAKVTNKHKIDSRDSYFLSYELLQELKDSGTKKFWTKFIESTADQINDIKTCLLHDLKKLGIDTDLSIDDITISFRFVTEELPFQLPPHIDMPAKLAVAVLYVESSGEVIGGGTQLYSKTLEGNFAVEKSFDFVENSMLIIPRIESTWHGGKWKGKGERKTFHMYIFKHPCDKSAEYARRKYSFMM
jgi:hypothetical protein